MARLTREDLEREVRAVQKIMDNGTDKALRDVLRALYLKGVKDGVTELIAEQEKERAHARPGSNGSAAKPHQGQAR